MWLHSRPIAVKRFFAKLSCSSLLLFNVPWNTIGNDDVARNRYVRSENPHQEKSFLIKMNFVCPVSLSISRYGQ